MRGGCAKCVWYFLTYEGDRGDGGGAGVRVAGVRGVKWVIPIGSAATRDGARRTTRRFSIFGSRFRARRVRVRCRGGARGQSGPSPSAVHRKDLGQGGGIFIFEGQSRGRALSGGAPKGFPIAIVSLSEVKVDGVTGMTVMS